MGQPSPPPVSNPFQGASQDFHATLPDIAPPACLNSLFRHALNPETNFEQRQKTKESQWHLKNDGAQLWILGIKTEGPGPVIITRHGGATELLGGLMYSSGGAETQTEPAFIFEDSRGSVTISEANFGNNAYPVLVRDVRDGKTVFELKPGQTPGAPGGSMIPLWVTPGAVPPR